MRSWQLALGCFLAWLPGCALTIVPAADGGQPDVRVDVAELRDESMRDTQRVDLVEQDVSCATGFADCDGDRNNGCETNLNSPAHCGSCMTACGAEQLCVDGLCRCPFETLACAGRCLDTVLGCTVGVGACARRGTWRCGSSGPECDGVPGVPSTEQCDGQDNDCDGETDELDFRSCNVGVGVCATGRYACVAGAETCVRAGFVPAGTLCRARTGVCDVEEVCDGVSPNCPTDLLQPTDTLCRASTDPCDPGEYCDGQSSNCPMDHYAPAGFVCRPAAGPCDVVEVCSGVHYQCPPDGFVSRSAQCRPSVNVEVCDPTEYCTGTGALCPADTVLRAPATEQPGNGADDDCDGLTDEP